MYALTAAYRWILSTRERRMIKRAFHHYVATVIVEQMLNDPSKLKLGGEEYEVTVLFSDLEGFTTLSEHLTPAQLSAHLGEYFKEMLDVLLPRLDFLSVGTNDLTQFLFAADRSNPRLAERYDWLSPAILRFLRRIAKAADKYDVPLGVCGEMGGRTLEAMALVGIGIRRLSITPAGVGPVKAMIRSLDAGAAARFMDRLLRDPPADFRGALAAWAEKQRVVLA